MSKVFISYSRKDLKEVVPFVYELRQQGVDCWFDESIDSGDPEFEETIMKEIDRCVVFLYMLSENSRGSINVKNEHRYAERTDKRIIPLLLKGAGDNPKVLFHFSKADCIDIYKEEQKQKLVRNLREWGCIDERIAGLLGELEKQRNRKDDLLSEINTSKPKLKGLIADYNAAAKEVFRLRNEISIIRTGHPESGDCESELISDVQETEKLKGRISELEKQIESLEAVKEKLEVENAEGSDHVRILESKLAKTENLRMESERVSAGLRETIDECNQQIEDGKEQIVRKDGLIASLNKKCSRMESELNELKAGPEPSPKSSSRSWLTWLPLVVVAAVLAFITVYELGLYSTSDTSSFTASLSGHDYVDLGLPSGTLWATCNVGASKPSDYGDYFAWGETGPKNSYEWENLKYCNDSTGDSFSKYNVDQGGTKDGKKVLDLSDDAAHAHWGGAWRMPTREEWEELREHCDWKWTAQDGCNGYRVTSRKKSGASIFLPAAGWRGGESRDREGVYGDYWSSSLYSDESYCAFGCGFATGGVGPSCRYTRFRGLSVRPVASSLQ